MSEHNEMVEAGYYGKLPAYGDFIQKRLPRDFIRPWDDWLQQGIAAAKERLGEHWLNFYLNCPALHFVMSPSICGEQACAGISIPSVDKVGRYFNFTLASMLPGTVNPTVFMQEQLDWYAALEELAITALGDELSQEDIEQGLAAITLGASATAGTRLERVEDRLRLLGDSEFSVTSSMPSALLNHLISQDSPAYGLWWHSGSSQVSAQLLVAPAMPGTEGFIQFLLDEDAESSLPEPEPDEQESEEVDYLDALLSD